MFILHTESSNNWGGQEIRILREALGMQRRGHTVVIAVQTGGRLAEKARLAGLKVYELDFSKRRGIRAINTLLRIIRGEKIDLVNTHSSMDAWLGGLAARFAGKKVIRTRHLSTPIRGGLNARLLYKTLADAVVTTSLAAKERVEEKTTPKVCLSIPTGIEPFHVNPDDVIAFRAKYNIAPDDILVGTLCIVRSWKGIDDLMQAANLLRDHPKIKWVIVGGGYIEQYEHKIDLKGILTFTGHIDPPYAALAAMDIFNLVSTAHEGVSQATLQASSLSKPLITTDIGGLPEVCINGETGLIVPPKNPEKIAEAVLKLAADPELRKKMGDRARVHVEKNFTFEQTLNQMQQIVESTVWQ
jgi:glycosyltransferase involved in cell wall biosynthesis